MHVDIKNLEEFKDTAKDIEAQIYLLFSLMKEVDKKVAVVNDGLTSTEKREKKIYLMMGITILLGTFNVIPKGQIFDFVKLLMATLPSVM